MKLRPSTTEAGSAPDESPERALERLGRSSFRSRFHLKPPDLAYLLQHGPTQVALHAARFIAARLAPAQPENDGKQTPWRGHPVFVAQHATATCCRSCLAKWHGMKAGTALDEAQQHYVVELISAWLAREAQGRELEDVRQAMREAAEGKQRAAARRKKDGASSGEAAGEGDDQNRQLRLF